jgi:peptide chain release factor 3
LSDSALSAEVAAQIKRRRTFAIISHPDAGKTTLTEKLLLFSGMIRTAGMVGGRKSAKTASSDWMSIEQERGISVTASAMQFNYKDTIVNVLDTPGHQDFSEDTYRTLAAADSVIMVLDCAKGVEAQTRKLFDACRVRSIPVITFINKMDLLGKDPIDLMEEVEEVLGIKASARNWPLGKGRDFRGVYSRVHDKAYLYTRTGAGGSTIPEIETCELEEIRGKTNLLEQDIEQVEEELELLTEAGNPFDMESFLAGEVTPVYFGSAVINFGLDLLFDDFVDLAPSPRARLADKGEEEISISPESPEFSAFIFKLQANMNPKHRDCIAFMRINSGRFEKDMVVKIVKTGKKVRLSSPHTLMVNNRNTLQLAYPGDVVGVNTSGGLSLGDTLTLKSNFTYKPLAKFQPELFSRIRPLNVGKRKAMDKGLSQLVAEGTVQVLYEDGDMNRVPFIGAVGKLQFEVLQHRLKNEYGVDTEMTPLPYDCSSWLVGDPDSFQKPVQAMLARDQDDRLMVLFTSIWEKNSCVQKNPDHELRDIH